MRSPQLLRGAFLLVGVAAGLFGVWSLLRLGLSNLVQTVIWLVAGVLGHDALLAGIALGLLLVGVRVLPSWARGPVAAGFVVLGTVTVMAIPVLGRFGARPDNPSLLDRSYGTGWLVVAGIVAFGVIAALALTRRREAGRMDGDSG